MKNIKLTGNTRLSPRKKNFFSTKIILVFQVEYAGYIDMFDNYIYQQKVQGWRDATVEDITDSHLILVN